MSNLSFADKIIIEADQALKTLFGKPQTTSRTNPATPIEEPTLSEKEARHVAGLMRINHAGEVSAQALYQGQALTARDPKVKEEMAQSALEENDHLAWCEERLTDLNSRTSFLNPLWYMGSLTIGMAAGLAGDKWSLGFVEETENQVVEHLDKHLQELPKQDKKTQTILVQMREDEAEHAYKAKEAGAAHLPKPIKTLMGWVSNIMTKTAYWA